MSRLAEMLREHEGVRHKPYKCTADKWTIAVGRNLEDNGLSADEIQYLLDNDIARVRNELQQFDFWDNLNEAREDALCDMLFNLGLPRFSQFVKMITALEQSDFMEAASQMLKSQWAEQVGKRAETLAYMVGTGEYK